MLTRPRARSDVAPPIPLRPFPGTFGAAPHMCRREAFDQRLRGGGFGFSVTQPAAIQRRATSSGSSADSPGSCTTSTPDSMDARSATSSRSSWNATPRKNYPNSGCDGLPGESPIQRLNHPIDRTNLRLHAAYRFPDVAHIGRRPHSYVPVQNPDVNRQLLRQL
jgi:hypothetical protein